MSSTPFENNDRHDSFQSRHMRRLISLSVAGVCGLTWATQAAGQTPYDLLLKNARVVDGTGSPWYRADVAIRHDSIVRIAFNISESTRRTIDVAGQVVTPGFIDIHSHARRGI